jgi:hypothetical protein
MIFKLNIESSTTLVEILIFIIDIIQKKSIVIIMI